MGGFCSPPLLKFESNTILKTLSFLSLNQTHFLSERVFYIINYNAFEFYLKDRLIIENINILIINDFISFLMFKLG